MTHHKHEHENNTMLVVILTAITMAVEIVFGLTTKSMALLADGIHMGSHVLAIGLCWVAYIFVRRVAKSKNFTGNSEKILSLSGYSSGLILLMFAIVIMVEAGVRFYHPVSYQLPRSYYGGDNWSGGQCGQRLLVASRP